MYVFNFVCFRAEQFFMENNNYKIITYVLNT